MTYKQTIEFLFTSLPMFQRIGDAAIKKDLTNIRLLCDLLGQPHQSFPAIHIAGTNGKGSTSHMLASVFQAAGKKVGLYTSPHYVDFRERIKINGEMISEKEVIRFVEKYRSVWTDIQPSFFEITVAMAFDYFRNQKVEIAIIETGLGGRLDSTNIISPLLSVITNIGFDHMHMLGNTLPEIAFEKAGIIKREVPVIIGEWLKETVGVFNGKALAEASPIHFASKHLFLESNKSDLSIHHYKVRKRKEIWFEDIGTDLTGPFQQKNLCTVLETIWCWNKYYPEQRIRDKQIKKGLLNVKKTTGMLGRWMVIQKNPLVITDAAHNQHGMKAMLPELLKIPVKQRHFVLGFVSDKDISKILAMFPNHGNYYWCSPNIPRGKPVSETREIGTSLGLSGEAHSSVYAAVQSAMIEADKQDLIFIGGSSYVVGDYLAGYLENKKA